MTRFQAGSRRRIFDESGTVLPLIALGLVTLLGFSALAVDVGMGYAETRRSQNAADAGALAGIVEASIESRTLQSMVTNAVTYSSINLPEAIPMSRWLTDCPDTSRSSEQLRWTAKELNLTPATDCISFSAGFDDIRVSLPQRDIDTVFASVLGIDSYDISAFAEAGASFAGVASTPPIVVTSTTKAGDIRCLRAAAIQSIEWPPRWIGNDPGTDPTVGDESAAADADPCDDDAFDRDSQFFGSLKAHAYETCTQPSGNNAIAVVIAAGIDHMLGSFGDYTAGDTERIDGEGCKTTGIPQPLPDTMELQTG